MRPVSTTLTLSAMLARAEPFTELDLEDELALARALDVLLDRSRFVDDLAKLSPRGLVLDVATGTAGLALAIAERLPDARVLGVDRSHAVLAIANERVTRSEHATCIELRQARARELPCADGSVDTLVCDALLHRLRDPLAFLEDARRVLRRDGVLLVRDLVRPASTAHLEVLAERAETPRERALLRAALASAFTAAEMRVLANESGFRGAALAPHEDISASFWIAG